MKLGIIGLPQSGKTTIFNALTRGDTPTTASAGRFEVHTAVVDVPDPRVTRLSGMFKPKKTIYAKVTYADIAGLETGSAKSGISGQLLNQLTQMDGFILVVRGFSDDSVLHTMGSIDAARDADIMLSELLLNDLISVERKLERLTEERKKGGTDVRPFRREKSLSGCRQAVLALTAASAVAVSLPRMNARRIGLITNSAISAAVAFSATAITNTACQP